MWVDKERLGVAGPGDVTTPSSLHNPTAGLQRIIGFEETSIRSTLFLQSYVAQQSLSRRLNFLPGFDVNATTWLTLR